ncbi:ABC transporter ATP-binding protein [Patulibacter sp. NPDC049589]|uniref:ABC transporter ATP-binding protein n=1 Tax=Patulibacter sp. NPDC049589 TaxID=3154731 RepID=UPI00341B5426
MSAPTTTPGASRAAVAPGADEPIVDVRDLHVAFRDGAHAVRGISLRIEAGQSVAIVGESGSGKSVTARSLVGLAGPRATVQAQRLQVAGVDARDLAEHRWRTLRGRQIGFVLQDALGSLDPLRKVGAEISETLLAHGLLDRHERAARVIELLRDVGVPEPELRAAQYPHQLSGGLRQRALIASALVADPPLLIADEPTTALDVTVQAQILELLAARRAAGTALLLISHDLAVVSQVADVVHVMKDGEVVEHGPTRQVLDDPQHPYTQRLIAAIPAAHAKGTRLSPGSGVCAPRPAAPASGGTILEAHDLRKTFAVDGDRELVAVDGVSLELRAGETLGIVGESGSGKSTVARLLLAFEDPEEGRVEVDGRDWATLDKRTRRDLRREIQVIHQDPLSAFDPRYTVGRIVGEPLAVAGVPRAARAPRVRELLEQVGLAPEVAGRRPAELSGGQRQRVAIARALAPSPRIIVCDEPVSALDVSIQAQVLDLLADLQERLGVAYVFISHHLGVIYHVSDRVLVMKDGRVVEEGDVEAIFSRPQHEYTRQLLAAVPTLERTSPASPTEEPS